MMNKVTTLLRRMMEPYEPSDQQRVAKARFKSALEEQSTRFDKDNLSMEQVLTLCGDRRVEQWSKKDPAFIGWFLDTDLQTRQIQAWADEAIHMVRDIMRAPMEPKMLTAKDKLQAASMLITLGNLFPAKQKEVQYLDREVGKMTGDEVDRKLIEIKAKLAAVEVIDTISEDEDSE